MLSVHKKGNLQGEAKNTGLVITAWSKVGIQLKQFFFPIDKWIPATAVSQFILREPGQVTSSLSPISSSVKILVH